MEIFPILERRSKLAANLWYVLSSDNNVQLHGGVGSKVISRDSHVFITCGAQPDRSFGHIFCFSLDTFILRKFKSEVPERYEHCAVVDDKENIVIFGGADQTGNRNDLQIINTREDDVTLATPTLTTPSPRTIHNCGVDQDRGLMWVWAGGDLGNTHVSDSHLYMFCLETLDWTKYSSSGEVPSLRHGHVVCHVTDKVYIHGGMEGSNVFSDLYVTDVENLKESCEWTKLSPAGPHPCARAAHSAAQHHNKMFIFGGFTGSHALNDLWVFDTTSGLWGEVVVEEPRPHPRLDLTMCTARLPVNDDSEEPQPAAPTTDASSTDAFSTNAPTTDASSTNPSSTNPSSTNPSSTDASSTNASSTDPSSTDPSSTNPSSLQDITSLLHTAADTDTPAPVVELPVSDHQDVIVLFGGMDLEGNIYSDIYLIKI